MVSVNYWVTSLKNEGVNPRTTKLEDFIMALPYLLHLNYVPPFHVMNEVLQSGEQSDGQGKLYQWQPFSLTEPEYLELQANLQSRGYSNVVVPPWVTTTSEWYVWLYEDSYGIPSEEHLRLIHRRDEIISAQRVAKANDDRTREELKRRQQDVESELMKIWAKYLG